MQLGQRLRLLIVNAGSYSPCVRTNTTLPNCSPSAPTMRGDRIHGSESAAYGIPNKGA